MATELPSGHTAGARTRAGLMAAEVVVELPAGHRDDPPGLAGLAALVARCTATRLRDSASARLGWVTSQWLEPHSSAFGFWSALDDLSELPAAFRSALSPVPADLLDDARRAQVRLAQRHRATSYLRMTAALDSAAWGIAPDAELGDEESLARIDPDVVAAYISVCRDTGLRTYRTYLAAEPVRAVRAPRHAGRPDVEFPAAAVGAVKPWIGGVVRVPMPAERLVRVAVRLPLDPPSAPPGAVELAAQVIGAGMTGLLVERLRIGGGLAYSAAGLYWRTGSRPSIGAHALVEPEHAATATEAIPDSLRAALVRQPSPELAQAAHRLRAALLSQLDQPFGSVMDERRRLRGDPGIVEVAAGVADCAERGIALTVADGLEPAVALVGAVP